jgi:hypothetical protein
MVVQFRIGTGLVEEFGKVWRNRRKKLRTP